jgi:Kef-type K+ transport system membrane component KefB/nucleotide-binding universal stress UspA family protein
LTDHLEHILHQFDLPLKNPVLVFSLVLFIILLAPILLRRLNIPGIIGLIVSGVIIGPNGFNLLEKNSAVDLFSTIGLLYIMFIAGLELDMNEFKANRGKSLVFGLFTFAIPLIIGYPVCHFLLGYDVNASFLTASMFATHTLVAYPIVSRLGVSKDRSVAITVGGTILTDTAVLIILAVVIGNSKGSLDYSFWVRLGLSLTVFSAIMFLFIPRLAKWFFSKLESEKHSHYIFVLSVVFFAAFLAELAGVEPIIGAFVSGLALNRLIPHTSALMNRIEFIGNSLFIPFFLISVGMLVDVRVILSGTGALMVAGTLSAVALGSKWLAAWATQVTFRFSTAQRQLIFGLSSAHAAATLAVILVGFRAGILDESILNGTIILILITCVVASFAAEKAAKQMIQEADQLIVAEPASKTAVASEHILIPIANVENFSKLLDLTILIKDRRSHAPISVLSVVSNDDEAEVNLMKARNKLEEFVRQGSASDTEVRVVTTIDHNAASGISRVAREILADLIIIGWPRRSGFIDKLIGEKVDTILSTVDKSVFVCRIVKPLITNKRIVVHASGRADIEHGFEQWLTKLAQLATELSLPVSLYSSPSVADSVSRTLKQLRSNVDVVYENLAMDNDGSLLPTVSGSDDMIMFVSARKGSVSYDPGFENMPQRLEKAYEHQNLILVYP